MLDLGKIAEAQSDLNLQLFDASSRGDLGAVRSLVEDEGAETEWKNPEKHLRNCLHAAAIAGSLEVVEYLVKEAEMDIGEGDVAGKTALDVAWENNAAEIAAFLKKKRFETSGTTIESEFEFVNKSLQADSPDLSRALATLTTLCVDPESRPQALASQFPEKMVSLFPVLIADESPRARVTIFQVATLTRIDSLKAILMKLEAFSKVTLAFTKTAVKTRDNLLVPVFHLITRGRDVRQAMCAIGEQLLASLLEVLKYSGESSQAAGITLIIAAFFPAAQCRNKAVELAKSKICAGIQNESAFVRNDALDCLMEAAAMEEVRPTLVALGVKEILEPLVKKASAEDNFVPSMIQALLSASDVSSTTESGTEPTSPVVITRIVDALNLFATTSKNDIETAEGFMVDCRGILLAARSLATNEANLKELSKQDLVKKMVALLRNRKEDLFLTNLGQLEEACYVIWSLSFDKHSKEQLIAAKVIELLKSLPLEHAGVKRGVDGALWNLEGSSRPQVSADHQKESGRVMISYSWGQGERMRQLASHFKSIGFNVWLDIEQMEGSVLEKMAEAIEGSSVIVIGLSSTYKDSQACRTEAEYAYKLKKEIAFVVAEDNFVPKGWLGALLGNQLWYSPWTKGFETEASTIASILKKKMHLDPNASQQQPASSQPSTAALPTPTTNSSPQSQPQGSNEITLLLQEVLKKVDGLTSMVSSVNTKLDSLQSQVTSIGTRLDAIEASKGKEKEKKKGFFK